MNLICLTGFNHRNCKTLKSTMWKMHKTIYAHRTICITPQTKKKKYGPLRVQQALKKQQLLFMSCQEDEQTRPIPTDSELIM